MSHIANIFRKSTEAPSFEKQLRQATSNKDAPVPNKVFLDISSHSSNYKDLDKIMKRIWRVLDAGNKRKWRKISKTLNLVDHLLKNGSFQCVEGIRDKKDKIMTFQQFYYFEGGQDRGFAIREQSDKIVALLNNRDILAEQRDLAQQLNESQQERPTESKLAHSVSLKPNSTEFNKENENITSTSHFVKLPASFNKNNPFKTTIPAPPENPLSLSRSKSNPASIDLLGLETPSTNNAPNENENKKQITRPQPQPQPNIDLINDNIAVLLEKKESSESSADEAHSHSHSDIDIDDQEFESIGYSHLNSRHQKKRDTQIRFSVDDIDQFDKDMIPTTTTTIPENQHSPAFSNLNNQNPFIQANEFPERPKMERKTSFNNPFRTEYAPNSNFNNPFRPKDNPMMDITKNNSASNNINENMNPNLGNLNPQKSTSLQNNGVKPLSTNPTQQQGPVLSSSEDLDQLALEFASKTSTKKTNLLATGGGQSHDEHEDIYMANPALMSRVSCPGNIGNYNNPFSANYPGIKSCKNNPFAPKLL